MAVMAHQAKHDVLARYMPGLLNERLQNRPTVASRVSSLTGLCRNPNSEGKGRGMALIEAEFA
jgi:hypothetical protein